MLTTRTTRTRRTAGAAPRPAGARRAAVAVVPAVAVLLAAGCGGDPAPDAGPTASPSSASPSTTPSASPSASVPPTSPTGSAGDDRGLPFPADLRPDVGGGQGSGNGLTVTDVRIGRQAGYDRVVLELGGTGRPGWRVEYVAVPRADGSGERLDLDGDSFLQVDLRGMGLPFETGVDEDARDRVPGVGGVAEVAPGGVFEGHQLAFVGLDGGRRPFRAFALSGPTRVVVDVVRD